jgi:predicted peroxiredoxin
MNTDIENEAPVESKGRGTGEGSLVILLTSGPEDGGKRATLAYSAACTALGMDIPTGIFLIGDGAHWGYEGNIADYSVDGFPALSELVDMFDVLGGRTYICSTCARVCGMADDGGHMDRLRRPEVEPRGLAYILPKITKGSSVTF